MTYVEAAVLWPNGKAYFFAGGKYIRYDLDADHADPGYPKMIAEGWHGVSFTGVDAVLLGKNGKAFFFHGNQYIRYDIAADKADSGYPKPIAGNWPGMPFTDFVNATVNWPNGKAYFFHGNQYLRYDIAADKADVGYPLAISGHWSGLPYFNGIDAVLVNKHGKAFFFHGTEYVRYDITADKADPGYPKTIDGHWPGLDFKLASITQPPSGGTSHPPDSKKPVFPIVQQVTGARGSAKVTIDDDGVVTLEMNVDTPALSDTTRYLATVLITGYKNADNNCILTDKVETHSLTLGSNPIKHSYKGGTWILSPVKHESINSIRHVHLVLERDQNETDFLHQFIKGCDEAGEGWDAANSLWKKVKHSELGQDIALAVALA